MEGFQPLDHVIYYLLYPIPYIYYLLYPISIISYILYLLSPIPYIYYLVYPISIISYTQIDSSTIEGNVEFENCTAVFLRHKCQFSFCVRQNHE